MIYEINLPFRLMTLNKLLRMHFTARSRHQRELAWHVRAEAGPPPAKPLDKAHITIERFSPQEPDPDGIRAVAKPLLDVLQPVSKKHPMGLGYIREDSSDCITLEVRHVKSTANKTRVIIREV